MNCANGRAIVFTAVNSLAHIDSFVDHRFWNCSDYGQIIYASSALLLTLTMGVFLFLMLMFLALSVLLRCTTSHTSIGNVTFAYCSGSISPQANRIEFPLLVTRNAFGLMDSYAARVGCFAEESEARCFIFVIS